ncbi:MAG: NAD(P)H-dependent oxidoreductase subunit E [Anaerolineae bacterium]|nr:NAD(P)H-dependent oxidoreductase subunit E [Anaerolineae bacterium]MDH7473354.1 NAD(P)H-dependent oxidoreductase subunit E [Anaerolineae bacterium]
MPLIPQPPPPAGGALLARLHAINAEYGYLPEEELRRAAEELGVPLSQVYSAATFYAAFSFQPRGRHTIHVCLGTACYIRGGEKLLEKLESTLGVRPGETTDDRAFTVETVHCVGSCSMSPVMRVDGDTYGRLRADLLPRILRKYREQEAGGVSDEGM